MHKITMIVIVGSFLPVALAHIGMWHPSVYGFNGDGYSIAEPLSEKGFDKWWMHGQKNKKPKDGAVFELPAGGQVTVELACNKQYTSFGNEGGGNNPCPPDTPSMHAGNPVKDSQLRGCGLAIAYKSDINDAQPEEFTVFSVNQKCVKDKNTVFQVPAGMPACPGDKCICAWFWQGQNSANEMYMNGFDCKITNPGNKVLAKPQVPVECRDGNNCIFGAKQPMYWANKEHQNVKFSGDHERKPSYNDKWGFKDGAQDIFEAGAEQPPALPDQPTPTGTPQTPGGCPAPVTVTVTVSKRKRPTPRPKW
ncbi:hypothetical protein L211DRAFT_134950 [Terfezia boudieri ATCC MYA-4762]|uniref:Lytic polysaccharide monooxygenase n=1 Tax=Terfezia boudieri ATCC MYA-4762 TaxID=1051890 RepID=A0A3N4LQ32_9PEZI|nr:hypothetical protein L211DRAFT_134950 [Terfezia boudieri ATCC MYA-4762]